MNPFRRREEPREPATRGRAAPASWEPADETWAPPWMVVGVHGTARPRRWDAVVATEAPRVPADVLRFTALPDGTLLLSQELPAAVVAPLAEALQTELPPPYRAEAIRRDGARWAIAGRAIRVVALPPGTLGDEIVLSVAGDERALRVDDLPSFGSLPELERLGARYESFVVRATRLHGDLWEVAVTPL